MVEMTMMTRGPSYSWWFDSHSSPKRSPWLQKTLTELEERTKAILKLIEEDADSFAQRAEMYYKKRPELITMVEEFYRAHRSLAEKYEKLKLDPSSRLSTPLLSPVSSFKHRQEKLVSFKDKSYESYLEAHATDVSEESDIDDPKGEDEPKVDEQMDEVSSGVSAAEAMKLKEEIERLIEENKVQKQQLVQKDEEKREASGQLRLAVDISTGVFEAKTMKLKEEIERLKEENKVQRQQLTQKDEEKREANRQLSLAVEVSSVVFEGEMMKLKEEIERLKEENKVQRQQLTQKDEEKREASRQLSLAVEVSSVVFEGEMMKLKEEIGRLKEENKVQRQQLMQKDEEKIEASRQLSLAVEVSSVVFEGEMMKLKEEIERLIEENKVQKQLQKDEEMREASISSAVVEAEIMKLKEEIEGLKIENKVQKQQLMQKDEEKISAIRQLSLAIGALKEENMNLKKCIFISKESSKKWSPANEFNKLNGKLFGKLFNGFPKSLTGVDLARHE
ncbi:Protein Networked (NET), actin-binding (NAB) domain [Dillenia turbinata]|uniref:Protein Networked (NET), actin-binding (NAB) domain n=1 Tax=Dillenia turbinata TaxID=194707 RepID=A0AAN8ZKH0_9MAGN